MIGVCNHVLDGQKADRVFAHCGEVIAAFCNDCEDRFNEGALRWGLDYMIRPDHALRLGLPLTIDNKEEATVFGQ